MKKLFFILVFLGLGIQGFAQKAKSNPALLEDLVKKSESQFKGGMAFLGGGTALIITAIVIPRRFDYMNGTNNQRTINFLNWTGILSIGTSIPLFLSSGYNGRTAAKLSLQSQVLQTPLPNKTGTYPAISLRLPIK
jgi:hypothetical protein